MYFEFDNIRTRESTEIKNTETQMIYDNQSLTDDLEIDNLNTMELIYAM